MSVLVETPIFDQLAAESGDLVCPICHYIEFRGLQGKHDRGDIDVCHECWMRGLHWPEKRAERTCTECGKFCDGMEAMVLILDGAVIPLCSNDYDKRIAQRRRR